MAKGRPRRLERFMEARHTSAQRAAVPDPEITGLCPPPILERPNLSQSINWAALQDLLQGSVPEHLTLEVRPAARRIRGFSLMPISGKRPFVKLVDQMRGGMHTPKRAAR